jgi:CheY-like chemotaxis protein
MLEDYEVVEAVNAETGIQLAKEQRPDLILMDIQLPGMDGLSATRKLKADPDVTAIPVVALTAYAMLGDEQKALEAGCAGYISKPLDTKEFPRLIARFLA